ncbi:MAG TPA: gliding motility lipoprotein GldH [Segetibacter sp.]
MKNFCFILLLATVTSCNTIDVYEKTKPFHSHEWKGNDKPSFTFEIADTISSYNIFFVFRHTDAYNYNNIWVNITTVPPGDTATTQPLDLKLADNQNGWLGSGMDDIFEHRIKITLAPIRLKNGKYNFTLQHIMREEPLQHVMNAGIRVEKIKEP